MKKALLAVVLILASCANVNKPPEPQTTEVERPWSGPGWYWGVYVDTEDSYWENYDYYHNNDNRDMRRGSAPQRGETGRPGGGGFHGGGGHR